MNTLAFTVCFAAWMMNGVLVTFLVNKGIYHWDRAQMGWLIGIPVLTGAITRLPVGILTDRYGGRVIFPLVMGIAAVPMFLLSYATSYSYYLLASLGFGLAGASFAVGVAYTSIWFPAERQGTALGIFGMGNIGAGFTTLIAPTLLRVLTDNGANLEGWRMLPRLYAASLVATAILFWLLAYTRKLAGDQKRTLRERLAPLQYLRVWRFGLYYFFVFGGFVALAGWLVPYYVNVYPMSVASAGLMATMFSLPAGLFRALGGWLSDRYGVRVVLYWVFGAGIVVLFLLFPPRMEIQSPGQGIVAAGVGTVTAVSEGEIRVGEVTYILQQRGSPGESSVHIRFGVRSGEEGFFPLPLSNVWQEPIVQVGETVEKGQLLARGITLVYFQANRWILSFLVFLLGILMGMGSAAVYKQIANSFPASVGVVGGLVGVIGALGGFFTPIIFGYVLRATGVWTTAWMFLALVAIICLIWMRLVVRRDAGQGA
ncbi:MAG: NarK/NasA family nitrate transporter [Chloroflexi bacterium]|nr:NarK/NasA family nitrate transporter [Chloroflexota bacterium]